MQLDLFQAEINKSNGVKVSALNAEASFPGWQDMAMEKFDLFLYHIGTNSFMAEQFRMFAEKTGLPEPPSNRAFGVVFLAAAKSGKIKKIGLAPTTNPTAHCANATVWVKA